MCGQSARHTGRPTTHTHTLTHSPTHQLTHPQTLSHSLSQGPVARPRQLHCQKSQALWDMGSTVFMALGFETGREKEARESQQVSSPSICTPPHTLGRIGGGDQEQGGGRNLVGAVSAPNVLDTPVARPRTHTQSLTHSHTHSHTLSHSLIHSHTNLVGAVSAADLLHTPVARPRQLHCQMHPPPLLETRNPDSVH